MARTIPLRVQSEDASSHRRYAAAIPPPPSGPNHCPVAIDIDPRYESSEPDWPDVSAEPVLVKKPALVKEPEVPEVPEGNGQPAATQEDLSNAALLRHLQEEFASFRQFITTEALEKNTASSDQDALEAECDQLRERISELEAQCSSLEDLVSQLQQQNCDLASQIESASASSCLQETNASPHISDTESLSWEDRKKLIFEQMEDESFDAETFVDSLSTEDPIQAECPSDQSDCSSELVGQLQAELENCQIEIARRDQEVLELQSLLQQQAASIDIGAEAGSPEIDAILDADERIQKERQRLIDLQKEWQERFRAEEIEYSLQRAKLARDRQQLDQKQADLEEQLAHTNRESPECQSSGSRRWLDKLGLTDS